MRKISNKNLDELILGLKEYKVLGVKDPWIFSDGTVIEPLSVLLELKKLRTNLLSKSK